MKNLEIEFKYRADDISLSKFGDFCAGFNPTKHVLAAGYDYFYEKAGDADSFCRLRVGPDANQLTFKRKTNDANNFIRTEHNIDLKPNMTKDQIEALVLEFGYKYNTSLYKSCFIYEYDSYIFVYYIVYDADMKELGRFIEVEMDEHYNWADEADAYNYLLVLEKLLKPLGISPANRVKRSLFELFRKESK